MQASYLGVGTKTNSLIANISLLVSLRCIMFEINPYSPSIVFALYKPTYSFAFIVKK
jgi:hypothetical protein